MSKVAHLNINRTIATYLKEDWNTPYTKDLNLAWRAGMKVVRDQHLIGMLTVKDDLHSCTATITDADCKVIAHFDGDRPPALTICCAVILYLDALEKAKAK